MGARCQPSALSVAAHHERATDGTTPFGGDDAVGPPSLHRRQDGAVSDFQVGPWPAGVKYRELGLLPSPRKCRRFRYLPGRRYLEIRRRSLHVCTGLVVATRSGACLSPYADAAG